MFSYYKFFVNALNGKKENDVSLLLVGGFDHLAIMCKQYSIVIKWYARISNVMLSMSVHNHDLILELHRNVVLCFKKLERELITRKTLSEAS